jgi:hypothetical membrane protein
VRFLALGGVAGPALFASVVIVCAELRPEYSHATQFISELGESGGSHASLMNFLGFIPSGLLLAAFGASLARLVPGTASSLAASILIAVYGLGIAGAGLYSCDAGCPSQGLSSEAAMHRTVSIISFAAGILGIALWARCFRSLAAWRSLWSYSAISSALALVFLLAVDTSEESRLLTGVWQRLSIATLDLWCAVVGLRAFLSRTGGGHTA